jgi:hypothetical protein
MQEQFFLDRIGTGSIREPDNRHSAGLQLPGAHRCGGNSPSVRDDSAMTTMSVILPGMIIDNSFVVD